MRINMISCSLITILRFSIFGPVAQNFTRLLANVTLNSISKYCKYIDILLIKMWVAFAFALQKLLTFLQQKYHRFESTLATTVHEFLINEFFKLKMLWITGPCRMKYQRIYFSLFFTGWKWSLLVIKSEWKAARMLFMGRWLTRTDTLLNFQTDSCIETVYLPSKRGSTIRGKIFPILTLKLQTHQPST